MSAPNLCSSNEFIVKCNEIIKPPFEFGYQTISSIFSKNSTLEIEKGNEQLANALQLASEICSMRLNPKSINEPFIAITSYNDSEGSWRSTIPDDLTDDQLNFIADVYIEITEPMIKARFSDLLWILFNPKKIINAQTAIENYLLLPITYNIADCWERCIKLAKQTNNINAIETIENLLKTAFEKDYPQSPFLNLKIAIMIYDYHLLRDHITQIAEELLGQALTLYFYKKEYARARHYFSLAQQFFKREKENRKWLDCQFLIAQSYEFEGDSLQKGTEKGSMSANHNYENALQAYRKIPNSERERLGVTTKMELIRDKITKTGQNILDEMKFIELPGLNISELCQAAINHVKDKRDLNHAILFFTGFPTPNYQDLRLTTIENLKNSSFSNLFSNTLYSKDGRVISKTSALVNDSNNNEDNEIVINNKIIEAFNNFGLGLVVKGYIIPALNQLLMEFRVPREYLIELCRLSPIVPENREYLLASALWAGFEYDFSNSIHLLAPQVEHMVRVRFKNNGIHTTTIDPYGIESENGLSTLLNHERAEEVLSEDLLFEMKAVFTEPTGANLRNNVAHGLLGDQSSASNSSVYAWWMILRLVVRSLYEFQTNKI